MSKRSELDFNKVHKEAEELLDSFTKLIVSEPNSRERILGAIMASSTLLVMITTTAIPDEADAVDAVAGMISRAFKSRRESNKPTEVVFYEVRADPKASDK